MEDTSAHTEKIMAWHEGQLTPAEQAELQNRMETDPAFKAEVLAFQAIATTFEADRTAAFRQKIKGIHQELAQEGFFEERPKKIALFAKLRPLLAIAAVFAGLIMAVGWWIKEQNYRSEMAALAREAIAQTPLPQTETYGMVASEQPDAFYHAVEMLKSGDDPKIKQAITALEKMIAEKDTHYAIEDLQWYLALGYLAAHQPDKAQPLLETLLPISEEAKSPIGVEIKKLYDQIKK